VVVAFRPKYIPGGYQDGNQTLFYKPNIICGRPLSEKQWEAEAKLHHEQLKATYAEVNANLDIKFPL
jgi:hypothetical protein